MTTPTMTLRLPTDLRDRLEKERQIDGIDKTFQIVKALREYFKAKDQAKMKEMLAPTALEAEYNVMFNPKEA